MLVDWIVKLRARFPKISEVGALETYVGIRVALREIDSIVCDQLCRSLLDLILDSSCLG
jgi:hypothetical protein